jgi:streptogramin lyase
VCKRLMRIALALAPAVAVLSCGAMPASGAPLAEVRFLTTPLPAEGLAAGPEGDMWAAAGEATARIGTSGPTLVKVLETTQTPSEEIVAGSDGNMWFSYAGSGRTQIGRLTSTGEVTEFNKGAAHKPYRMTLGPEGDVWYTAGAPAGRKAGQHTESSAIGRITPSGQVTEFTKGLSHESLLGQIATGPDGDLWFVNESYEPSIGRVTPTGEIKEFPIAGKPWLTPSGIAAGTNGNVYFAATGENGGEETESVIGELTPNGETKSPRRLHEENAAVELATGPEGSVWFTERGTEPELPFFIGRLTPEGTLDEEVANLDNETEALQITPGPDGNMWFIANREGNKHVAVIGTGAPGASQAPPAVTGADEVGSTLSCEGAVWSTWAGQQPSASAFGFDGYTWLLDGGAIAGQRSQSLLASAADLGQQVACSITATYPLLNLTASATSAAVTIGPAPLQSGPPPVGTGPVGSPASVLTLPHQTDKVSRRGALDLTVDCSGAPCSGTVKLIFNKKVPTGKGRHRRTKTKSVTIASASFSSLPFGEDKLALKLTRQGLSLLESHDYKLAADAGISYVSSGASHVSIAGAVELKGTKPKRKA